MAAHVFSSTIKAVGLRILRGHRARSAHPASISIASSVLIAFDPASGKPLRSIDVDARAGTAFDGQHLFQLTEGRIQKIDPKTGRVLATIPAAVTRGSGGPKGRCGWGSIGTGRSIKSDAQTGAILRTIESNRFVTGVTWIDGELWYGAWACSRELTAAVV